MLRNVTTVPKEQQQIGNYLAPLVVLEGGSVTGGLRRASADDLDGYPGRRDQAGLGVSRIENHPTVVITTASHPRAHTAEALRGEVRVNGT